MRPLILLASLAMLLASCEPGEENADAGNIRPRRRDEPWPEKLAANTASHQQLAAQGSLGKPPAPRILTATGDVCPIHHQKMNLREIPIVFEDDSANGSRSTGATATAEFPFGAEKIVSTGNALLPGEARTARVYQCAACVAARRAVEKMRARAALRETAE